MKFKGTYFLLLFAVLLGAYIYFVEIKKAAKDEDAKTLNEKVFGSQDVEKSKGLELKNTNGDVVIEKDAQNHWQIKSPIQDLADDQTISGMLTSLSSEKFDDVVAEGAVDLKIYGLDNPKDVLTLTLADGKKIAVKVGIDAPMTGKLYLKRDDEQKVLFGNNSIKFQCEKSLKDLRDKRIFRGDKSQIESLDISYKSAAPPFHVELKKTGPLWMEIKPNAEQADQETVTSVLSALDSIRATDFASEKAAEPSERKKYLLTNPTTEFVAKDKDGKVLSKILVSAKKDNNIYMISEVQGQNSIYQLFSTAADGLIKKPEDFRDKKTPYEFKKEDVSEIILKTSMADFDLLKKASGWELAHPEKDKDVSQIQISSLLEKLGALKTTEFIKQEIPKGLTPNPKGIITLKNSKGEILNSFAWGEKTKSQKSYFMKTFKSGGNSLGVDSSLIDGLPGQTLVETRKAPTPNSMPPQALPQSPAAKGK
jgi:hypothetical protein